MTKFKMNQSAMRNLEQQAKQQTEAPLNASLAEHYGKPESEAARLLREDMSKVGLEMTEAQALHAVRKARRF